MGKLVVFLVGRCSLWGSRSRRLEWFSSLYIESPEYQFGILVKWLRLIPGLKCLPSFSTVKFCCFSLVLFGNKSQAMLKRWEVSTSTSLQGECLHKVFIILPPMRFVSSLPFIYSISDLYQSGFVDIGFILWVIIQHYVI